MNAIKAEYSVYVRNMKNKAAIVCPSVSGRSVFITAASFDSFQEFAFWKSISDEDYRVRETGNRRERSHTVPIDELPETMIAGQSCELDLLRSVDNTEDRARVLDAVRSLQQILTPSQLRRYWFCEILGVPKVKFAEKEGCTPTAVVKSIRQARAKIAASGLF